MSVLLRVFEFASVEVFLISLQDSIKPNRTTSSTPVASVRTPERGIQIWLKDEKDDEKAAKTEYGSEQNICLVHVNIRSLGTRTVRENYRSVSDYNTAKSLMKKRKTQGGELLRCLRKMAYRKLKYASASTTIHEHSDITCTVDF